MEYICPKPQVWNEIYNKLMQYYEENIGKIKKPPVPLILNGWVFSSDYEKKMRWQETIEWAKENNCIKLIPEIEERDKYIVETMCIIIDDPYGFEERKDEKDNE